jgi:2-polyprenyl-3-methyl-5-hydroxy-6-metoxy-1,4-benzoquinol methylase
MSDPRDETIAAYQADATAYAAGTADLPASVARDLDEFAARVVAGGRVLEIGSGPGRDARELEARGLVVRRTDITPAFVELMRADGFEADVLDPLVDDLGGPYDGVWIDAVLMHVARADVPVLFARLAAASRPGATLYLSTQEGEGEAWLARGHVTGARHFTFWREEPLRAVLAGADWQVELLRRSETANGTWLDVFCRAGAGA